MSDRIDHAALAGQMARDALSTSRSGAQVIAGMLAATAQVHATLALVDQQRIANLIALAGASDSIRARQQAEEVLYQPTPIQAGIDLPLTPDIAAALGIKAVDDE